MKALDETVNLDDEVEAIAAYIKLKWSPISNLNQLVQDVRVAAVHAARALFEDHPVWEVAVAAVDARVAFLEQKYGDVNPSLQYYDAGCRTLENISAGSKDVRTAALNLDGDWQYEDRVNALLQSLVPKYPDLVGSRPNGWNELETGYNDFDGQEEYDNRPDRAIFGGTQTQSVSSGDFVSSTALPYVMYDEKCQGRKAHYVLVGAILSHFMLLSEFLNTRKICNDLEKLVAGLPQEHVYSLEFKKQNPVLTVLIQMGKPFVGRREHEDAISKVAAYEALSDEEKAIERKKSQDHMNDFIENLRREPETDYRTEKAMLIAPIKAMLMDALAKSPTLFETETAVHRPKMR